MSESIHAETAASQQAHILEYLKTHRGLSQAEAIDAFGCYRLGARIYDLKAKGYNVEVLMEDGVNRFGRPTRYARYFVSKKEAASNGN